jgi:hypothetical protein
MAETVGTLAYKMSVESAQFNAGMNQAGQQIDKLAQQSAGSSSLISSAFGRITDSAKSAFNGLTSGGISGAVSSIGGSLTSAVSGVAAALGPAGLAVAAFTAGLAALANQGLSTSKALADVTRFARVIGDTPKNAAVVQRVLQNAGLDAASAQQTMLRFFDRIGDMRRNLETGGRGGETGDILRRIGLDPVELSKLNAATAFEEIAVAISGMSRETDRASAASAIFGRSWQEIESIMRRGRGAFQDARRQVEAVASEIALANAARAAGIQRERVREFGELTDGAQGAWNRFWARMDLGWEHTKTRATEAAEWIANRFGTTLRLPQVPGRETPANIRLDPIREANRDAENLLRTWQRTAETIGMSTREVEIFRLQQRGADVGLLEQQDRLIRRLEEESRLRKTIADQFDRLRPESLALTGMDFNSLDNFKLLAGLQTMQNNGLNDPRERDRIVLDAINDTLNLILDETRDANRNAPRLAPAPRVGGGT